MNLRVEAAVRLEPEEFVKTTIFETVGRWLPPHAHLMSGVSINTPMGPFRPHLAVAPAGPTIGDPSRANDGAAECPFLLSAIEVSCGPWASQALAAAGRSGVACTWEVILRRRVGYRGPTPVIFVRVRHGSGWRELFYFRGRRADVPLCVGITSSGGLELISVPVDPGAFAPNQWLRRMASGLR